MKRILFIFILAVFIVGCKKSDDTNIENYKINDGCYTGTFSYQGNNYWSMICFDNNNYEEWPSGGVLFQKHPDCLTIGTYSINNNKLTFEIDSFKFNNHQDSCIPDMLLSGEFKINDLVDNDSLIFEKGIGENRIIYYLKD